MIPFKKRNGVSISEYLCRLRLKNAELLLAGASLPITVVASEVGFPDASYFSRLFHRQYGLSPSVYRAKRTEAADSKEPL